MDACLTGTHAILFSSLHQLPELQWLQWDSWCLQGLAGRVACSGGIQQPL
jgi:hypothetical protein